MQDFEKLGAFYLGKVFDTARGGVTDDILLYDAKDLTTHAVCVGMTGSGKTGLCLSLLEEAAIDGIPAIAIDPKGDLGNLLLAFPELRPEDFRPWVDEGEATRKGMTPDAFAASTAALWKKGLGDWGQDGARIARYRDAVDVAVYTPGSSAGLGLSMLKSFAAPPPALRDDADAFRERIGSAASGLLALLGIDADPLKSREHILLANILQNAWSGGRDLDIAALIREIQTPSFDRIGVMDVDSFYPAKDRMELCLSMNGLIASPGFAAWLDGEPLDIQRLLWTPEGKPRLTIVSIAHLSEAERMFTVTLLLNEVLAWVRSQPGTTSLRALLYMDEVFGYFPPTANPPSKTPMLTLLKQSRAFGLGVVLATQNPVDLDYKGLSNTGTWFLGRLQTERDKARVLEGLEGASAAAGATFDKGAMEATLAGLGSRVFLMNNVHEDAPVLFHTRWALSYLRGPLTRTQIQTLMAPRKGAAGATGSGAPAPSGAPAAAPPAPAVPPPASMRSAAPAAAPAVGARPLVPPDVPELFVRPNAPVSGADRVVYRPALYAEGKLHFVQAAAKVDTWTDEALFVPLDEDTVADPWSQAEGVSPTAFSFADEPLGGASFGEVPGAALGAKSYAGWSKDLASQLYQTRTLTLWKSIELKLVSEPGESEGDFRVRLAQKQREARDLAKAKLEQSYGPKLARLQEKIRKTDMKVDKEKGDVKQQGFQTAVSFGATVLGAFLGRKKVGAVGMGRAATTMRGAGRTMKEKQDVERAEADLAQAQADFAKLEEQFQAEVAALEGAVDTAGLALEAIEVRPRKADITIGKLALAWLPWREDAAGAGGPLYR